jgi:hypothetical protein
VATSTKTGFGKLGGVGGGDTPAFYTLEVEFTPGVWTDLSSRLRAGSTRSGRQAELDRVEAGTATFTLSNRDRALDPTNAASVLYPNVLPMRRIRFRTYYRSVVQNGMFTGYIENWPPQRRGPADSEVTITCVDRMAALEAVDLDQVYGAQKSGARIVQVLADIGWSGAADPVAIDTGVSTIDNTDFTTNQASALSHLLDVADSEGGIVFCDGDGVLRFFDRQRRQKAPYLTSQGTFGDNAATEFPYVDLRPSYDVAQIYNDVVVNLTGDPLPAAAQDTASMAAPPAGYGPRTLAKDTILFDWADAQAAAQWYVYRYKQPQLRFDSLVLKGSNYKLGGVSVWEQIFARELSDRITVIHRPPGGGAPISQDCFIEGISHEFAGFEWKTTWQLSPAPITQGWLLGTGALGQTTVLYW